MTWSAKHRARTLDVRERAAATLGRSSAALYSRARDLLVSRNARGRVVDVGCGCGELRAALDGIATAYIGIDVVRFADLPEGVEFREAEVDRDPLPVDDGFADVAIALETIEHVENARRFVRELARITRPRGTILLSTPNQLSALSLFTLLRRGQFNAFQERDYPAHLTALLPVDLIRIAGESGLENIEIAWSHRGRIPLMAARYPTWLSRRFPQALSDHVLMAAQVRA